MPPEFAFQQFSLHLVPTLSKTWDLHTSLSSGSWVYIYRWRHARFPSLDMPWWSVLHFQWLWRTQLDRCLDAEEEVWRINIKKVYMKLLMVKRVFYIEVNEISNFIKWSNKIMRERERKKRERERITDLNCG